MQLSAVSFLGYVDIPGSSQRQGVQLTTPGVLSIQLDPGIVTVTTKTGSVMIPWSQCASAKPAQTTSTAKK
jgi:hypothetical protein